MSKKKKEQVMGIIKGFSSFCFPKEIVSILIILAIFISFIPSFELHASASYSPEGDIIVNDNKLMDIYLNLESSTGYNIDTIVKQVNDKLLAGRKNGVQMKQNDFRIRSNQTTINTTDLSNWYVYDHYDTSYWGSGTTAYPPANWVNFFGAPTAKRQFFPVSDNYGSVSNLKTSIENNNALNTVRKYDSHIYSYEDTNKLPGMTFVGYGYSANTDFLFYPADNYSTKKVSFDVNASDVIPHSLSEAGFLINTGIETINNVEYIKGYILTYAFSPEGSSSAATGISAVSLYKIKDGVTSTQLHNASVTGYSSGIINTGLVTLVATSTIPKFNATLMSISLEISPTSLKAYHTTPTNGTETLFNTTLTDTGYGGFGPFVAYTVYGHTCSSTSSFKFSNLKMSMTDGSSGTTSVLDALNKSNYSMNSEKYFINLLNTDNSTSLNEKDWEGIARLRQDQIFYVTNKQNSVLTDGGIINPGVNDQNGKSILSSDNLDELTTKIVEYILGSNTWTNPATQLQLSKPIGIFYLQGVDNDLSSKQLETIVNNYFSANGFDIYAVDQSQPGKSGSVEIPISTYQFTLRYPEGSKLADETMTIMAKDYPTNGIFKLFNLSKTDPTGEYTLVMTVTDENNQTSNATYRTIHVLTDNTPPAVSLNVNSDSYSQTVPYSGTEITINASDLGGEKVKAYEFGIASTENAIPVYSNAIMLPEALETTSIQYPIQSGKYKLYIRFYDKAGNFTETSIWVNPKINTITYNLNGGVGTLVDSQLYQYGQAVNLSNGTGISMSNATFKGWAYSPTSSIISPNAITISAENTNLYAIWQTNVNAEYHKPFYLLVDAAPQIPAGVIGSYKILSGSLPEGLTLNGTLGSISGTTTSNAGTSYEFDVQIEYQGTTIVKKYCIQVNQQSVADSDGEQLKAYLSKDKVYYGDTVSINGIGGFGTGSYSYTIDQSSSQIATLTNTNKLKLTGSGIVVVHIIKAADTNYSEQNANFTFYVNKREITPIATAISREYDGTCDVDVSIQFENQIPTDTIFSSGSGKMVTADAGDDKLVLVSGIELDKYSTDKYVLSTTAVQTSVEITKKVIDYAFSASSKEYDGTNLVKEYSAKPLDIITGDDVQILGSAIFDHVTVKDTTNATFTPTGMTGASMHNYMLVDTPKTDATAKINKAEVVFQSSNDTYYYDNNPYAAQISAIVKNTGTVFTKDKYTVTYTKDQVTTTDLPKEVGVYTVNVTVIDNNYFGSLAPTTLTIKKAEQTSLSINGIPNNVLESGDEFDISVIGGNGDGEISIFATNAIVSGNRIKVIGLGTVSITVTKAADHNYEQQQAIAKVFIQPKTVTFAISNNENTYDGTQKKVTVIPSISSLVDGVDYKVIGGSQTNAGTYEVSVQMLNSNYRGSATGIFTIKKANSNIANLTIGNSVYGTPLAHPTAQAIGGTITYTYAGNGIPFPTPIKPTNAGNYTLIATLTGDANHEDFVAVRNFYISKKTIVVTVNDQTKVYGEANPAFTLTYSGFEYGENESQLYLQPIATTNASATSAVEKYDIVLIGGYDENYIFSFVNGILTILNSNQMPFAIGGIPSYVTYGDEFEIYAIGDLTDGTVAFRSLNENAVVTGNRVKILHKGNIEIEATKTVSNYVTETATKTFYANPKQVTFEITNLVQTYTGTALYVTVTPSIIGFSDYVVSYDGNHADVGEYKATVTVTNSDYMGEVSEKLTIVPSAKVYKIICDDKTYDGLALTPSVENVDAKRVTYTFNRSPITPKDAGEYEIVATIEAFGNEPSATIAKVVTINKKSLTIIGAKQTKLYGEINPALTYSYNGFVEGEDEDSLITKPIGTTNAATYSEVGKYDILFDNADALNYSFVYQNGELEILPSDYDGLRIVNIPSYLSYKDVFKLSILGGKGNGEVTYTSSDENIAKIIDNQVEIVGVGNVTITAVKAAEGSFKSQSVSEELITNKKKINLVVPSTSLVYNGYDQDIQVLSDDKDFNETIRTNVDGLNGDIRNILNSEYITATYIAIDQENNLRNKNVGQYQAIVKVAEEHPLYTSESASGFLKISKAPITITADNKEKLYGEVNPSFTMTYQLLGEDTSENVIIPTITCQANKSSQVGIYPIVLEGEEINENYSVTLINGTLEIHKSKLVITADHKTKYYSKPNPTGTASYEGFVNKENDSSLSGTLKFVFGNIKNGNLNEEAGNTYDITPSGYSSKNYDITYVGGVLTVKTLSVTVSSISAKQSTIVINLSDAVANLRDENIIVQSNSKPVLLSKISSSSDNKTYSLYGTFEANTLYDITIEKPNYLFNSIQVTPTKTVTSGGGGGGGGASIAQKYYTASYVASIGGKISGDSDQSFTLNGITTKVEAVAHEGYEFVQWSDGIKSASRTDKLTGDISVTAEFKKITKEQTSKFSDINGHWAEENIQLVTELGLFSGTSQTQFSPDMDITRGMFVTVLGRLAKANTNSAKLTYNDVDSNAYYSLYIAWASENKIVNGVGEDRFEADRIITREEMTAIIIRYINFIGYELELNNLPQFSDEEKIGDWAKEYVHFAKNAQIVIGNQNNDFQPNNTATRAEVATILTRLTKMIQN